MNLGEIIRRRREELGLTQDQVSVIAGISKPYLSNVETGRAKNPPTDGVLESLAEALQIEPAELLRFAHLARTPADVRQEHELLSAELAKLRGIVKGLLDSQSSAAGGINLDALARVAGRGQQPLPTHRRVRRAGNQQHGGGVSGTFHRPGLPARRG